MKKWMVISLGIILLLLGLGVYGVYQFGGLKYYLQAVREINKLEGEEKTQASEYFNDESRELKVGRACFGRYIPLLG